MFNHHSCNPAGTITGNNRLNTKIFLHPLSHRIRLTFVSFTFFYLSLCLFTTFVLTGHNVCVCNSHGHEVTVCPPQEPSVSQTQSFGPTRPPAASVLSASSPALLLGALKATCVDLKEASVGRPPLRRAPYAVTPTAARLMECCFASRAPAARFWLRAAPPATPCRCSEWKWSIRRTGTRL